MPIAEATVEARPFEVTPQENEEFRAAAGQSARIRDLIVTYSELQLGQINKQRRAMPCTTFPAVCVAGFCKQATGSERHHSIHT